MSAVRSNTMPPQTSSRPGSLAAQKSVFAQNRIQGIKRESNIDQIMQTGSSQTPRQPLQSEAARRAALQSNLLQAQINPAARMTRANNENAEQEEAEEQEQQTRIQTILHMTRIKGLLAEAAGIDEQQANTQQTVAATATQDAAKQAAKKMIPKAANVAANAISSALDLGTGGVALLVTIFVHLLSLGWLNVEMIYGTWIKKGKDPIIGPLTWAPIPMPVDKNGVMLQGLVIMADILLLFVVVIMVALQALMLLAMFAPYLLVGYAFASFF